MNKLIPIERIENKIYLIRGQKVLLDKDLAELYGVKTKNLNKAVSRNLLRFPPDFMFQLNKNEFGALRFHFGTSNRGGRRYFPYVFTEQGVAMLSSVLNSEKAVLVNTTIMRTFVKLRKILGTHKNLARKLSQLEDKFEKKSKEQDIKIEAIFGAIRQLMAPPEKPKRQIGFLADRED